MTAVQVQATSTLLAIAGNRDFFHMVNNSDTTIYVCYDGTAAATVAEGLPVAPNQSITLDNTGPKMIYNKAVYAIHGASGDKEVRLQGV